jgi:predicted SprT family Zn-dependent metalloprotease
MNATNLTQLLFRWPSRREPPRVESAPATPQPEEKLEARARGMLRGLGCRELATRVKVRWNPRLRSTAGLASYSNCTVTLNPRLTQFGEAEVDATLRHELAHLLAKFRAGRRRIAPHGPEWKQACADLGLPGEKRCHNLPLPRREVARKHFYQCPSCLVEVRRVRPFRSRVACLECCRRHNRGRYDDRYRLVKVAA